MNKLNPKDIASVNVNKSNSDGKESGEINIKTKD